MTRIKPVSEPSSNPEFEEQTPVDGEKLQWIIKTRATQSLLDKLRREHSTALQAYNEAVDSLNYMLNELGLLDIELKAGFPGTPTDLSVTSVTSTSATLNWSRPSEAYIAQYQLLRRLISGGSFEVVATIAPTDTYTFTGLASDTEYRFGVAGVASDGTVGIRSDSNIVRTLALGGVGPSTSQTALLHGGGTHNAAVFSPNGGYLVAFADVGGTRSIGAGDSVWSYLPTGGNNASRQVAGGCVTNDGLIYQTVGTTTNAGKLQRITIATGAVDELAANIDVRGNATTPGDSGSRPRPVGYMVLYDSVADYLYVATEDGVLRYNVATSTSDGIIALKGESCRALCHTEHGILSDADTLLVATRTKGLVLLQDIKSSPSVHRVSPPPFGRFEDAAYVDRAAGTALAAGHTDGVYRYDATGYLRTNDERITAGSAIPADISTQRYSLEFEGVIDWSTASGELISAWGSLTSDQTIRLMLEVGVIIFRLRHAGGLLVIQSDAALTEGFVQLAVRARPTSATNLVIEKRAPGGSWVQIGAGSLGTTQTNGSPVPLTIGETAGGANRLPVNSRVIRAGMRKLNADEPVHSIDLSGVLAGATTATGVAGDTWSWPVGAEVVPGGLDVTPALASGTGANGNATRWTAVGTTIPTGSPTTFAALGMVNPDGGAEWVYRTLDAAAVDETAWEPGTPARATMALGSQHNSPANRIYGDSASGNDNSLVGTFTLAFDPDDDTGNTLVSAATLSLYRSQNFAGTAANIAWESHNNGLAMISVSDAHFDGEGNLTIACADHNAFAVNPAGLLTAEMTHVSVSNIRDAWSVTSVGTGANKITVLCATSDTNATDSNHDIVYHRGTGAVDAWQTTGYRASLNGAGSLLAGERPRPGGGHLWDRGDGNLGWAGWADGIGFVRTVYTYATDAWANYQLQDSGPATNLTTQNQLQERQVVGSSNGDILFGIQLSSGQLWRSSDGGANWSTIANTIGTGQEQRTGRIEYIEDLDVLIASDATGLFRIDDPRGAATVTRITGITTACIITHYGTDLFVHVRGSGPCDLLQFTDIVNATSASDGIQIGSSAYRYRVGDLACTAHAGVSGGTLYIATGYQGSGIVLTTVPA